MLERLWLASPHKVELPAGVPLKLEYIPAGTFMMGSPETEKGRNDDENQHQVTVLKPFYMSKYPVTQEQWQIVMGDNPSHFKGNLVPLGSVSLDDATSFCQKLVNQTGLSFRLPAEAEWEFGFRAGTATPFHFGEKPTIILANYNRSAVIQQIMGAFRHVR